MHDYTLLFGIFWFFLSKENLYAPLCFNLYRDHKMQKMKRHGGGSGSEDDPIHSGKKKNLNCV